MEESSLTVTSVTQEKENIDAVSTEPSDTSMFKEMQSEGISSWIYGFYHEKKLPVFYLLGAIHDWRQEI